WDSEMKKMDKKTAPSKQPSAWDTVQIARHPQRPLLVDYLEGLFTNIIELHGDRAFGDDRGMFAGFATLGAVRAVVVGHRKGRTVEEKIADNFGMASPEGYRKALRAMRLAEKFGLPVIAFVDTPGAYPGADAEARGQAEAIARNLAEMSLLKTPIVVVVTGEGGSGGALGIAVGDRILMLEHAIYSVISPEGCASILWRDGKMAPQAAEALQLTAPSLQKLGVVDAIVPEPKGGAHANPKAAIKAVGEAILKQLAELKEFTPSELVEQRYAKFTAMGRHA
ncbi:MAG: acetyl-CoA carboxylase carboxyltransferase subunit alpha, partial [Kiritimatiellia bacterium]